MDVHVLEIKFGFGGKEHTLYFSILQNEQEVLLIDCGYAGFMPLIANAAKQHGLSLQELTGIIITHHDIDHIGGLFEIKEKYPHIRVYSSGIEKNYINGKERSLRLLQAERIYDSLPEDQKPGAKQFQELLKTVRPVAVDHTFSDEDPAYLKDVKIVNTPGHMPGHISIYLEHSKTLIAADALVIEHGEFEIANPGFTLDLNEAIASVRKLQQLDIDKVICYHGGVIQGDIQARLNTLLAKYQA